MCWYCRFMYCLILCKKIIFIWGKKHTELQREKKDRGKNLKGIALCCTAAFGLGEEGSATQILLFKVLKLFLKFISFCNSNFL